MEGFSMYITSSQPDQTVLQARNWVKKGRYVFVELCACSMRHCIGSQFFLHEPLEKLYPLAHMIALDLSDWLSGVDLRRDVINQPYLQLLQADTKPEDLAEFLKQLQIFFEESLKNGFNAPAEPVKSFVLMRFHSYLQEAGMMLYGLSLNNKPVQVEELVSSYLKLSLELFGN
jgi:hypothetical protein